MHLIPEHERLFDEISTKLNELSFKNQLAMASMGEKGPDMEAINKQQTLERMQGQIRRFQDDLQGAQEELKDKIKNLENVQYQQNDLGNQLKVLSDQLSQERATNTKLNSDLAKSLEMSLQLQLEIQGLKARQQQAQLEEKKFNQSLVDKIKALQNEVELHKALKEEVDGELGKAKQSFHASQEVWKEEKNSLKRQILEANEEKNTANQMVSEMSSQIEQKNQEIASLNDEIEKLSAAFEELHSSAGKQREVLKNLMETAESKIVEMKLALDRKSTESQDYYAHLQQSLTQCSLLKSENMNLREHIEKLNQFIQATQAQAEVQS
jgi:predicted  nucleic acid-binding Zn-ribbon protein